MSKVLKPVFIVFLASIILLLVFFIIAILVSGWFFARQQFSQYWYYLVTLAIGFGIQVGLFSYFKTLIQRASKKILAVTGTTSTLAMISCCSHYLANILPIVGISGLVAFVAQYQLEFFWVGIVFNLTGIIFIAYRIRKFLQGKVR